MGLQYITAVLFCGAVLKRVKVVAYFIVQKKTEKIFS
jgi:hypothetical protein